MSYLHFSNQAGLRPVCLRIQPVYAAVIRTGYPDSGVLFDSAVPVTAVIYLYHREHDTSLSWLISFHVRYKKEFPIKNKKAQESIS